jgi:hypothetical protein
MNGAETLELPDDPILLRQIIAQRESVIAQRDSALALCDIHIEKIQQEAAAALAQRESAIAQREAQLEQVKREAAERIEALQQQHKAELAAVLRRFYGPRCEKFDPRQLLIFGLAVADQIPVERRWWKPRVARSSRPAGRIITSTGGGSCRPICRASKFPTT